MLGTISTGAVDDFQRATQLARRMVTEFGMSEKRDRCGMRANGCNTSAPRSRRAATPVQQRTRRSHAEVRRIVGEQFKRAATLVAAHRDALSQLSGELLKAESLDGSAVRAALSSASQAVAS